MKFSNSLIANIARVLQIGILTGTDIVDHLRTFIVEEQDGELSLTDESLARIEKEINVMIETVESQTSKTKPGDDTDGIEIS